YQAAEVEPPVLYKEMEWFAGISSNITIPVCDPVIYEGDLVASVDTVRRSMGVQEEAWRKHDPECVGAIACDRINIAPSARFAHTAVLYKSWNFERDVKDHPTLCKSFAGVVARTCGPECIEDTSCMAPAGMEDSWTNARYFDTAQPEFWSLPYFEMDDGESFPMFDHHDIECPPYCCGE
ncbi:hypothetical protein FOZ63_034028, partial [Perkinsus olseni]